MLTVGLLAVVVYLYTVVAFNFFRKFYNKSEDEDSPDMKCDDMMTVSLAFVLKGSLKDIKFVVFHLAVLEVIFDFTDYWCGCIIAKRYIFHLINAEIYCQKLRIYSVR